MSERMEIVDKSGKIKYLEEDGVLYIVKNGKKIPVDQDEKEAKEERQDLTDG